MVRFQRSRRRFVFLALPAPVLRFPAFDADIFLRMSLDGCFRNFPRLALAARFPRSRLVNLFSLLKSGGLFSCVWLHEGTRHQCFPAHVIGCLFSRLDANVSLLSLVTLASALACPSSALASSSFLECQPAEKIGTRECREECGVRSLSIAKNYLKAWNRLIHFWIIR